MLCSFCFGVQLCDRSVVTGPFAWLFGLYKIIMPATSIHNGRRQEIFLPPNAMIVHAVKHMGGEDSCDNTTTYEQRMIIGEGVMVT